MEQTYIFNNESHKDFTAAYMTALGMDQEQIDSVIAQRDFELSQNVQKREAAYKRESDPLYMEWQYDQTEEAGQKWRDKVAEIKERFPLA
ncbi:hypothetical protein HGG82_07875 [Marinomonas sp. M1K-6]|uniref:Uncharacterized protein n=1 Tax=Marinomonas profundi TaxID=2726122 RepID=A0A847R1F4_9GAMM|nr:hypothetical protein [Marinomonas profundi]NLQ17545.1 hypothetical protein [Marinomonas profundi]UDV02238.1 hypothetical protein J8N69_11605 [Marinomonas profundi]